MPRLRARAKSRRFQVYYPRKSRKTAIAVLKLLAKNSPRVLSIKQVAERLGTSRNARPHRRIKSVLEELARLDYCTEYGKITNPVTRCSNCKKSGKYLVEKKRLEQSISAQQSNTKDYKIYEHKPSFDRSQWFICEDGYLLGKSIDRFCQSMKCFECNQKIGHHGLETKYKIHYNERYWSLSDNGIVVLLTLLNNKELLTYYSKNSKHKIIECINILIENAQKDWVDALITRLKTHIADETNALKYANEWLTEQYQRHEFFSAYRSYGYISHGLGAPIG